MKKLRTSMKKFGGLFAAFALMLGVASAGAFCMIIFHQPEVPAGINKLIKR